MRPQPRGRPGRIEPLGDDGVVVAGLDGMVQDPEGVAAPWSSRAPSISAFSSIRSIAGSDWATARRASSCRNPTTVPRTSSTPARSASASGPRSPTSLRSRSTSIPDGITATRSSAAIAPGLRAPTRASTASTIVGATRASGKASTSETKNGFPPVIWNSSSFDTLARGQPAHRPGAQARQPQPRDSRAGQAAEDRAQRVVDAQRVIAERDHQDGGQRVDPPSEVTQHVQRRPVRPVRVLDDEHGRREPTSLLDGRREEPALVGSARQRLRQRAGAARPRRAAARAGEVSTGPRSRRRARAPDPTSGEGCAPASSSRSRVSPTPARWSRVPRRPARRPPRGPAAPPAGPAGRPPPPNMVPPSGAADRPPVGGCRGRIGSWRPSDGPSRRWDGPAPAATLDPLTTTSQPCRPAGCAGLCTEEGLRAAHDAVPRAGCSPSRIGARGPPLAGEAVQEALVRAWRSCSSFDPRRPAPALAARHHPQRGHRPRDGASPSSADGPRGSGADTSRSEPTIGEDRVLLRAELLDALAA